MNTAVQEQAPTNRLDNVRIRLTERSTEITNALGPSASIPVEKFIEVTMMAVRNTPAILDCTQNSVWNAIMRAARDGLLPDGREGAIVTYKKEARWMPMIGGIRKLVQRSGEVIDWSANVVYAGDEFDFQLGDNPHCFHKPVRPVLRHTSDGLPAIERLMKALRPFEKENFSEATIEDTDLLTSFQDVKLTVGDIRRLQAAMRPAPLPHYGIIACYATAKLKDGTISRELMWIEEIEGVRSKSQASSGPWNDPVFYPEMCRKTVLRRHAKALPLSPEVDEVIRRDDDMFDFDAIARELEKRNANRPVPKGLAGKLDALAAPATQPEESGNPAGQPDDAQSTQASSETATPEAQQEPVKGVADLIAEIKQGFATKLDALKWTETHEADLKALGKADRAKVDMAFAEAQAAVK